jgi:hypothetical protein
MIAHRLPTAAAALLRPAFRVATFTLAKFFLE